MQNLSTSARTAAKTGFKCSLLFRQATLAAILMLAAVYLSGCSSKNDFSKGKEQLEQQGYTEIVNTGHKWFCCDEKDTYSTGFKCKDKSGKVVEGCFCSTVLKGVTVRFK